MEGEKARAACAAVRDLLNLRPVGAAMVQLEELEGLESGGKLVISFLEVMAGGRHKAGEVFLLSKPEEQGFEGLI